MVGNTKPSLVADGPYRKIDRTIDLADACAAVSGMTHIGDCDQATFIVAAHPRFRAASGNARLVIGNAALHILPFQGETGVTRSSLWIEHAIISLGWACAYAQRCESEHSDDAQHGRPLNA
ncbi:hypothetical protein [Pseudorhodoplanes sp.]|uniref:hypothetical protein n=1 Tax=Pseudorhodoplanes sp. TaxID=1934341 RepID=UPI002C603E36|nr:hypothetical protein [Pseudorhodoplanes sp.]HWV53801.1 hypothetical protein [Pseudorhodoplanes sp.]